VTTTDEPSADGTKRILTSRGDGTLAPGKTITFEGSDGTGYTTQTIMTVSNDGCMLNGSFTDKPGNTGYMHLLYQSSGYYVLPK
jgi:hypothetical protein